MELSGQVAQLGNVPDVFAEQPIHASFADVNARGAAHVSSTQDAFDVGGARVFGVNPIGHEYGATKQNDRDVSGREPSGQVLQTFDPAGAYVPTSHGTHVSADDARRVLLAVPPGQAVQIVAPSESLYDPSLQSEQSEAFLPPTRERAVPATQNWSQILAPLAETQEPGGQRRHVARPATGEYEPGGQGIASVPPGQNEPREHATQDEIDVIPDVENEPTGHGAQSVVEAIALLYRPGLHGMHTEAPVELPHVPAGQDEQKDAPPLLYSPIMQSMHADAPVPLLDVPGMHRVHDIAPSVLLHLPDAHCTHDDTS